MTHLYRSTTAGYCRVLRPYSDSMKGLIKNGYSAKVRPSGHDISTRFRKDNGGAIPPNLLTLANTESNSQYLRECRQLGIGPHPARFPRGLPEFFIKFLTNDGDTVLDPFAGSCVTGEAAEGLRRRWIDIETEKTYVKGAHIRFAAPESAVPGAEADGGMGHNPAKTWIERAGRRPNVSGLHVIVAVPTFSRASGAFPSVSLFLFLADSVPLCASASPGDVVGISRRRPVGPRAP